jgi:4-amino-4-deoxy-L-arabinose transferase-like glycosyltransferase
MTARHHTVLATLLVLGGLFVMRLTNVEIQPYPEGLYALRGLSIQQTMQWLDQAAIAPGGMYSAMMPPLPAWMVAVGIDVVGPTPLAVRWFSVLCVMVTLLLTYALARRAVTFESSVMAMVIVGTSIPYIVVGRQADALVPLVMAALAIMWSSVTLGDAVSAAGRVLRVGVLAIAVAAGVLSAPIATLVVCIACVVFIRSSSQRLAVALGIGGGLLAGLPWWIVMASRYGEQVLFALSLPTPTLAVTSGGVLSPLHFLIVSSPLLVVALIWVVAALRDRTLLMSAEHPEVTILGLLFAVGMLSMAISQDRFLAQAVVLVPPASILAMIALEHTRRQTRATSLVVTFVCVVLAAVWFTIEHLLREAMSLQTIMLGVAISMVAVVLLLQQFRSRTARQSMTVRLYQPIVYGAVALASVVALVRVVRPGPQSIMGGRSVSRLMLDDTLFHRSFAYVFHNTSETDAVNAQLEWYTKGWMSGTRPGLTHMAIALPANESDNATLAIARLLPWVVYYHPRGHQRVTADVEQSLQTTHTVAFTSDHYTLFKIR